MVLILPLAATQTRKDDGSLLVLAPGKTKIPAGGIPVKLPQRFTLIEPVFAGITTFEFAGGGAVCKICSAPFTTPSSFVSINTTHPHPQSVGVVANEQTPGTLGVFAIAIPPPLLIASDLAK